MPILLVYMIYQDLLRFYLLIYLFDFQIVLLNFIILHDPPYHGRHHRRHYILCVYFEAESMAIFFSQTLVKYT